MNKHFTNAKLFSLTLFSLFHFHFPFGFYLLPSDIHSIIFLIIIKCYFILLYIISNFFTYKNIVPLQDEIENKNGKLM